MNPKDIDALEVVLTYLRTGRTGRAADMLEDLHRRLLDEAIRNPRPEPARASGF